MDTGHSADKSSEKEIVSPSDIEGLTRREMEVLEWVAKGKTNSEIGLILGINRKTISKHLENIFPKLGVESRTAAGIRFLEMVQAARYAREATASMQFVVMNAEAEGLCQKILQTSKVQENDSPDNEKVSREIAEFFRVLQEELRGEADSQGCNKVQLRQVVEDANFPSMLRGFLIPGQNFGHEPRFLVLMEKNGQRSRVPTGEAKKHFHLTDREDEIVKYLADGQTNIEIGATLDISTNTVKGHIKNILTKTNSTTRTGILSQVLRYSLLSMLS